MGSKFPPNQFKRMQIILNVSNNVLINTALNDKDIKTSNLPKHIKINLIFLDLEDLKDAFQFLDSHECCSFDLIEVRASP